MNMSIFKKLKEQFYSAYHFLWALLSAIYFRFPARKLTVIGITGTKGKSSTVELVHAILSSQGDKVASLSSVRFKIGDEIVQNKYKMTMPGRGFVQRFLRKAVNAGCKYAVLEVTSEGILQHRNSFIPFFCAVFTNLAPEHIERHGSFENYRAAKGRLFSVAKEVHVINADDANADYFFCIPAKDIILYGINSEHALVASCNYQPKKYLQANNILVTQNGSSFKVDNVEFLLSLPGTFNIYNALAALGVGYYFGIGLEAAQKALSTISFIPGRMEHVIYTPFHVFVDYAHTPDSLEAAYAAIIESGFLGVNGKIIAVLGSCGGGRDKWKRLKLGEVVANFASHAILTNEDPYDEDPMLIIEMVKTGITSVNPSFPIEVILDRKQAIKKAVLLAKSGDVIVITGKGCEPWMCMPKGEKIPWDDREIVREAFKARNSKNSCGIYVESSTKNSL